MATPKDDVLELVRGLPDDSSLEDIQYHLYVRLKVEKGLQAAREGRVIPQEEAEKRMAKWLGR